MFSQVLHDLRLPESRTAQELLYCIKHETDMEVSYYLQNVSRNEHVFFAILSGFTFSKCSSQLLSTDCPFLDLGRFVSCGVAAEIASLAPGMLPLE
jgi:hypothetical protein